ncbi:MAG: 30S ribosomal protein S19e [Promethearchaeota archaeon]
MPSVYDVPANELIKELAEKLKKEFNGIQAPPESIFWKTACTKEIAPIDYENFWYIRCASLLRKIYMKKNLGVNKLRKMYGDRDRNHVHKKHKRPGSGAIIRRCLQQLETVGLVKTIEGKGRILTPKGHSLLDKTALELYKTKPIEYYTHFGLEEE